MTQRDPGQPPMEHDPNAPHRNPNLMQPGHDPDQIDQRPKPTRRTSSLWIWVLIGAVVLIALISLLTFGTTEVGQAPTATLPQGESASDAQ
ncbi:hypothetical protein [Saliniramus sp.]|uniref:hypothetical protein n=1 Tax=Saliniramus sp. TaxID=2986772 RepID=UPI002C947782|nr:hypothetical protein [Saliniramus sp.]HMB12274.1 hypothetical protein [Saliniramus sp.]